MAPHGRHLLPPNRRKPDASALPRFRASALPRDFVKRVVYHGSGSRVSLRAEGSCPPTASASRRLGSSASPPAPGCSAGLLLSSDRFEPSAARAGAGVRPAARRLRGGLAALLLGLPLLAGLATEAAAQTLSIEAPANANEGDSGTTGHIFTVRLSQAVSGTVAYRVCFGGGTATLDTGTGAIPASADYQLASVQGSPPVFGPSGGTCNNSGVHPGTTTSTTIAIRVKGDTVAESDETVTATLELIGSPPAGVTLGTSTATHTILNDDAGGGVSVSVSGGNIPENGVNTSSFKVSVSPAQSAAVPIRMCLTSSESSLAGITVRQGVHVLTLTKGCTTGSVPAGGDFSVLITGKADSIDKPDESIRATLSADPDNPLPAGVSIPLLGRSATLVIVDDDPTVVRLARVGTGAIAEGQTAEFTVTLGRALVGGELIDVPLTITGAGVSTDDWSLHEKPGRSLNTGVSLQDPETALPFVRFRRGARTATLLLQATGDNANEGGSETFTVALGPDGSATYGSFDYPGHSTDVGGGADPHGTVNSFTLQVNDATTPAELSIEAPADANEGDSGTRDLNFTVRTSRGIPGNVNYKVCFAGTATIHTGSGAIPTGADYQQSAATGNPPCVSGTFSSSAIAQTRHVTIKVKGDTDAELDETVIATLSFAGSPPAGATLALGSTVTHTIRNDDGVPNVLSLKLASTSGEEGDSGHTDIDIRIAKSTAPSAAFSVRICATGSASHGGDYQFFNGSARIGVDGSGCFAVPLSTSANTETRTLRVLGDTSLEADEQVILTLQFSGSAPSGWIISTSYPTATYTIKNDEPAPASISPARITEGRTVTFTVIDIPATWTGTPRLRMSGGPLVSTVTDCAATEIIPNWDVCAAGGRETWDSTARVFTFELRAHENSDPEGDETFTVELRDSHSSSRRLAFTLTIVNVPPLVSIEALDNGEVTEGSPVRFRIGMDPAPSSFFPVKLWVGEEGQVYRVRDHRYVGHATIPSPTPATVKIPASGSVVYSVPTVTTTAIGDRDTKVHAMVMPDGRYGFANSNSATVTVRDGADTAPATMPVITVLAHRYGGNDRMTEGEDAVFSLIAEPAPTNPLTVNITVIDGGDFLAAADEGTKTVTIPAGERWETVRHHLTLATVDDGTAEAGARVTVRVTPGSGYLVGNTVTFADSSTYQLGSEDYRVVEDNDGGPRALGAPTAPAVPDTKVRNVRVTGVTPMSATVHWDAVPHAAGYRVEMQGQGATALSYFYTAAGHVTGTSVTLDHGASESMTVRVLVTPKYVDGAGMTQLLHNLAGGADFEVTVQQTLERGRLSQGSSDEVDGGPGPVGADPGVVQMVEDMIVRHRDVTGNTGALAKWEKALKTLRREPGGFTVAELEAQVARLSGTPGKRWQRVLDAVNAMLAGRAPVPVRATLSATPSGDIAEKGGFKQLRVTLDRALEHGERVAVPLVFGGTATRGQDYVLSATIRPVGVDYANLAGEGTPTLTFNGPPAQSTGANPRSATLMLYAESDEVDEGVGETVTVEIGRRTALDGGPAGTGRQSFTILEPLVEIAIAAETASMTEGGEAVFTVTSDPAPDRDLAVKLAVSETGGDFVAADDEGAVTVTIFKGKTEASLTVATTDDAADEPDGTLTVRIAEGSGYVAAASPGDAASVAVSDDDEPVPVPEFSVADVTAKENVGLMWFTVRLSLAADRPVSVSYRARESNPVSARQGQDFLRAEWSLHFRPGETEKRFWVGIFNDSHDEGAETFEIALYNARGARIADGVAIGTIVNDDPMPKAWLGRFGRTVAQQALDGLAGRLAAPRTPGAQGTLAGQAFTFGGAGGTDPGPGAGASVPNGQVALTLATLAQRFGGHADRDVGSGLGPASDGPGRPLSQSPVTGPGQSMTVREALRGSRFTLTGQPDATGGSMALWGRTALATFDGREGTFSLDGDVTTGLLGADYARGRGLVGVALLHSAGRGAYTDTQTGPARCAPAMQVLCDQAVRAGDGRVKASLTAAVPYAAFQATERLRLWGAAGYGAGTVTLTPETGGTHKTDLDWTMAAAGLRGRLLEPAAGQAGPVLALTSDALWAGTGSDQTQDLAASESDVTRLRLGLEGSYRVTLDEGGQVTPRLAVGARHDGGDAETGFGVELGGGLAWRVPAVGLTLDVEGRTLLAHAADDFKDQGVAASLVYQPDPVTQRGPSVTLRQDWGGAATGGVEALFAAAPLAQRQGSAATSRWMAEAAYGVPVLGGRFTGSPHVGLGLAPGTRDYRVGWRLTPTEHAPTLSFDLTATRQESAGVVPAHSLLLDVTGRW